MQKTRYPKNGFWPAELPPWKRPRPPHYRHANWKAFVRLEQYRPLNNYWNAVKVAADLEKHLQPDTNMIQVWPNELPVDVNHKMFR